MLRHTTFITHYSQLYWHASSYVHLLKVVFGVESACEIKTHGSESRGPEEAACMRVFWPTRPLQ